MAIVVGVLCPLLGGIGQFFGLGVILWTGALAVGMCVMLALCTTPAHPLGLRNARLILESIGRSQPLRAIGTHVFPHPKCLPIAPQYHKILHGVSGCPLYPNCRRVAASAEKAPAPSHV